MSQFLNKGIKITDPTKYRIMIIFKHVYNYNFLLYFFHNLNIEIQILNHFKLS